MIEHLLFARHSEESGEGPEEHRSRWERAQSGLGEGVLDRESHQKSFGEKVDGVRGGEEMSI